MPHRSRLSLLAILLSALALLYLVKQPQYPFSRRPPAPAAPAAPGPAQPWRVPLEAHIMSMCPDARDCLESLVIPAMALLPAATVNFTLSFIGRPTDGDGGVECPHGPRECLGDMLELCAARLYPGDPKRHLGFAMCLSRRYDLIPQRELVERCAATQGVAFERLNQCASGEHGASGMDMLRKSVQWSAQQGVVKSCTVCLSFCRGWRLTSCRCAWTTRFGALGTERDGMIVPGERTRSIWSRRSRRCTRNGTDRIVETHCMAWDFWRSMIPSGGFVYICTTMVDIILGFAFRTCDKFRLFMVHI
jgi:hypothetical protein